MDRHDYFSSDESEGAERPAGASDARSQSRSTVWQLRSVVTELLTALKSTLNDERASAKECLSRAAVLLQTAGEANAPRRPTKGGLAAWQVRTLTSHVETNLDKPIRSSELATVVRLNPAYFCRVFRESFGEPPLQYISRRRIERAQELMLSTDTSLSQIAFDCGFADQATSAGCSAAWPATRRERGVARTRSRPPARHARSPTRRATEVLSEVSARSRLTGTWMPGSRGHDGAAEPLF